MGSVCALVPLLPMDLRHLCIMRNVRCRGRERRVQRASEWPSTPALTLVDKTWSSRYSSEVLAIQRFVETLGMATGMNEQDLENGVATSSIEEVDYEHLIEDYSHLAPPSEGELLRGHVVKVTLEELIVDVGLKLEGLVPIDQVRQPDGTVSFKAGDP